MSREDLARRAVAAWTACGFDWMPGMETADGLLVVSVNGSWLRTVKALDFRPPDGGLPLSTGECAAATKFPNLDHFGTLGCVEHGMLPAAWARDGELIAIDVIHTRMYHLDPPGYAPAVEIRVRVWVGDEWEVRWAGCRPALSEGLVRCLEAAAERRRS